MVNHTLSFSIITPSYNQANYLPLNLESVVKQTYPYVEHLIYDPGSTDGSIDLARDHAQRHKQVKFYNEPDRGQVHAINKGLAVATGDILTWLNSDDYYIDDSVLADVAQYFEEYPDIDVVYGRGYYIGSDGSILRDAFVHKAGNDFQLSLQHSIGIIQPSLFFRRSVYEEIGGLAEEYNLSLDYEYWIRMAKHNVRFGYLDRYIAKAVFHDESKTSSQRMRQLNEILVLVRDSFGYVPFQWIKRYSEYFVGQIDRMMLDDSVLEAEQADQARKVEDFLLTQFDTASDVIGDIRANAAYTPYRETLEVLAERKLMDRPRQIVVTSFDSGYFWQGLNLIASLHRTSYLSVDQIIVYALHLSDQQRSRLELLENVTVLDFPHAVWDYYPEYMDPKSHAFKSAAIKAENAPVQDGDLVLWLDAGIAAIQDIQGVFDLIAEHEFFITDHNDKANWPFYNINFTHPGSHGALNVTNAELLAPHLCSCVIGYLRNGKYQRLVDEAHEYAQKKEVVVWTKYPPSDEQYIPTLSAEQKALQARLLANPETSNSMLREELLKLFSYSGHRMDQPIYSVLASRYNAPSFPAMRYNRSNDDSSKASQRNWVEGSFLTEQLSSRDSITNLDADVVLYHHRGVYHNLDGLRYRRKGDVLFVIGSGPSLKGVDLTQLSPYASIGMNAAYRYWDEINWYPTYYCCMDLVVLESHREEIYRLIVECGTNGIRLFFLRDNILNWYPDLADNPAVIFLEKLERDLPVFHWPRHPVTTGSFSALFGWYLGYRQIYLLGIDLNYVEVLPDAVQHENKVLELVADPTENPNYFFPGYQRKGDRYNIPNVAPNMHIRSWLQVQERLVGFPFEIVNLNSASALKAFPFDTIEAVLKQLTDRFCTVEHSVSCHLKAHQEMAYWRTQFLQTLASVNPEVNVADSSADQPPAPQERIEVSAAIPNLIPSRFDRLRRFYSGGNGLLAAAAFILFAVSSIEFPFAWLASLVAFGIFLLMLGNSVMGVHDKVAQESAPQQASMTLQQERLNGLYVQMQNLRIEQLEKQVNELKRSVDQRIDAERSERIVDFARRDTSDVFPQRCVLMLTIPRSGSTWMMDMLRAHPNIEMEPSSRLSEALGLKGGRYPIGLANGPEARMDIEIMPGRGSRIPVFSVDAPPLPVTSQYPYVLEKLHPAYFGNDPDYFLEAMAKVTDKYGTEFKLIYQVRQPRQVLRSFRAYKRRDPGWYGPITDAELIEVMLTGYSAIERAARARAGFIIDYAMLRSAPEETVVRTFKYLWHDEDASLLLKVATEAKTITERDRRRESSPTSFLGESEGEAAEGEEKFLAAHSTSITEMEAIFQRIVSQ